MTKKSNAQKGAFPAYLSQFAVRISPTVLADLDEYAKAHKLTRSNAIRRGIRMLLDSPQRKGAIVSDDAPSRG